MIVLTPAEMAELDRRTIEAGTPADLLMERAAAAVVEAMGRHWDLSQERVAVVCGKGNNGGDGRIVERLLGERGVTLSTESPTLVVDAVLGTGTRGEPRGEALSQIRWMRQAGVPIVAVDVPSGLGTGGEFVSATLTVTFEALKPVHVMPPWCDHCGTVEVARIGMLPATSRLHQVDRPTLARRPADCHKGQFGHVLVLGGAPGKSGAALMTGLAALRAGAGLVTVSAPVSGQVPELMTCDLDVPPLEGKTVVAIGPGLGLDRADLVRHLYATCPLPMVVDADAISSLAGWDLSAPPAPRILTPHPGEFRRLAPLDDRVESARSFATRHQVTMVLKGYRTLIAEPDGTVWVNPTGSPAMAKAGSGDILTGLIAGFYAQEPRRESVPAAVWLHGRCGQLGEAQWTDRCLLATDLLGFLPAAIREGRR